MFIIFIYIYGDVIIADIFLFQTSRRPSSSCEPKCLHAEKRTFGGWRKHSCIIIEAFNTLLILRR